MTILWETCPIAITIITNWTCNIYIYIYMAGAGGLKLKKVSSWPLDSTTGQSEVSSLRLPILSHFYAPPFPTNYVPKIHLKVILLLPSRTATCYYGFLTNILRACYLFILSILVSLISLYWQYQVTTNGECSSLFWTAHFILRILKIFS